MSFSYKGNFIKNVPLLLKCILFLVYSKVATLSNNSTVEFIYLLLIEFEVRAVKYGPSFFPSIYGPSAKRAGHKSMGKNEDPYFTVRTEKTRLIRYLLYLSFWRKETISSQSRLHLNDARVKCKKKAKFIGLHFAVGSQRRKLQTF